MRTMLREHGDLDSLGYFATRRDKAVVWDSEDPARARAGISYRVVRGVSLASGNPVGDPEHWPAAIEAWRRDARENGWSLAVMAAGSEGAAAFEAAGLTVFEIGDEAILDLGSFSLNAPGLKPVRQAVSRLRRRGYDVEVRRHDALTAADFERLAASAASWRGDGGDERGFSMALGRLGDPLDGDCVLVEAHDGDGDPARLRQPGALGTQRSVARPDAPRPDRRQRPRRAARQRAGRAGAAARRAPGVAELRDVP